MQCGVCVCSRERVAHVLTREMVLPKANTAAPLMARRHTHTCTSDMRTRRDTCMHTHVCGKFLCNSATTSLFPHPQPPPRERATQPDRRCSHPKYSLRPTLPGHHVTHVQPKSLQQCGNLTVSVRASDTTCYNYIRYKGRTDTHASARIYFRAHTHCGHAKVISSFVCRRPVARRRTITETAHGADPRRTGRTVGRVAKRVHPPMCVPVRV